MRKPKEKKIRKQKKTTTKKNKKTKKKLLWHTIFTCFFISESKQVKLFKYLKTAEHFMIKP